jgi:acetyl esterase/lipase
MSFALKNLAVIHQQYFNDPVGGYRKGYDYYGDQFAVAFIRHVKGNAEAYHLDPRRICAFGHSKGSEIPGMLVNRRRAEPAWRFGKVDYKKTGLTGADRTLPSPFDHLPADIAGAIMGAGIANQELRSDKSMPWADRPTENISPFFLYADHRADTREYTRAVVEKARAHGVPMETAEQDSHTWPRGPVYDQASAFADRILGLAP